MAEADTSLVMCAVGVRVCVYIYILQAVTHRALRNGVRIERSFKGHLLCSVV